MVVVIMVILGVLVAVVVVFVLVVMVFVVLYHGLMCTSGPLVFDRQAAS